MFVFIFYILHAEIQNSIMLFIDALKIIKKRSILIVKEYIQTNNSIWESLTLSFKNWIYKFQ